MDEATMKRLDAVEARVAQLWEEHSARATEGCTGHQAAIDLHGETLEDHARRIETLETQVARGLGELDATVRRLTDRVTALWTPSESRLARIEAQLSAVGARVEVMLAHLAPADRTRRGTPGRSPFDGT